MVELKEVTKVYGEGEQRVLALNGLSLTMNQGERVALIGKSGAGKSTLLHLLAGVEEPTSGNIWVGGVEVSSLRKKEKTLYRRRNIGIVFQFFHLIPVLTVRENMALPLEIDNRKVDGEEVEELAVQLGIKDKLDHFPSHLSGGQQQRVAIGRALIHKPDLLLADEPTGNLDSKTSEDVLNILTSCSKQYNQTLLVVTHDMEVARQCERIVTIQDGKIVQ